MSTQHFDVVVVGSGTSAYFAIAGLTEAGKKVAVVDERPYGGTCALRGCQPKKFLVANAEAVAASRHLDGTGITGSVRTDWTALQALKNEFLDGIPEGAEKSWKEEGVATFHGHALMTGENEITVGDERLTADHIILATGASPRRAEIEGSEWIKTSDDFLSLEELPRRVVFIGGGYISFEFAHVAKRAGAEEVTILHRSKQALKNFEPDMVDIVIEAGEAEGIHVVLEESPTSVASEEGGFVVEGSSGASYQADLVIEATGRVPNLGVLEGGAGNVDSSPRGIAVNEFLQSPSNPRVYAIGDCAASGILLAPVADAQGKIAARNILEGNVATLDESVIPSVTFTIPQLASVGLCEDEAREAGHDFRVNRGNPAVWPSSKRIGEKHAGYKMLIENGTGKILGAHLVRHEAAEVINVFALAMKYGIPAHELVDFLWAYPTMTSDLRYMVR